MQVSLQQQREKVLIEGGDKSRTPHHNSNKYQSAKPSATELPSSSATPMDYFIVQTLKYPSKFWLFLWIVIEEGFVTFTLRIYLHHFINNYLASCNCCALHQLWFQTPGSKNNQDCNETMQVTWIKRGIKIWKNIHTIKEIRSNRTRRSEVNAYNWELIMLMFYLPNCKDWNTTFLNYATLEYSSL
ncbi:hypothetical protein MKX03_014884 [Papaver bracteatum]|nr:hypothetical protein MKX03_014884 [Papaver bracteatum]